MLFPETNERVTDVAALSEIEVKYRITSHQTEVKINKKFGKRTKRSDKDEVRSRRPERKEEARVVVVVFPVPFSFYLYSTPHFQFPPYRSPFLSLSRRHTMALKSVSPIPHLTAAVKPSSVLSSSNNSLFFVDFVGLYCRSKRTRRRLSLSSSDHARNYFSSSVKAVLDLQRANSPLDRCSSQPDSKRKVCFLFCLLVW